MSTPIRVKGDLGCRLWMDGVGNWLLWFPDRLCIGNGAPRGLHDHRLAILGDLASRHASWFRRGRDDVLLAHGRVRINGRDLEGEAPLISPCRITLGEDVELAYSRPSGLSHSAVLTIESGHRLAEGWDGVVLFAETCLLGPTPQSHIPCREWEETMVFYEWDGALCWKSQRPGAEGHSALDGDVIGESDWRVRMESVR